MTFRSFRRRPSRRMVASWAIAVAFTIAALASDRASAATCNWTKTGVTATNWNASTGNWSCGHFPVAADDVVFLSPGVAPCNLNVDVTVTSISLNSGATTVAATAAITITLSGNFSITTGTFTSTSGRFEVGGNFSRTGGTFNANGGQVMLTSTSTLAAFAASTVAFNDLTINDGLQAYFKLDDASSPSVDSSGWGRDAVWGSTPSLSGTTPTPTTLAFTDPGSFSVDSLAEIAVFTCPDVPVLTLSAWIKATGVATGTTYQRILEMPGYTLFVNNNTLVAPDNPMALSFTANHATTPGEWKSPSNTLTYGAWYHVAVTYNSGSTSNDPIFYINGVRQPGPPTEKTAPTGLQTSNVGTTCAIGNRTPGLDRYFNGLIDELRIYDRMLSDAEIASLAIGHQPGTFVGKQNMTGTPTIAGDLVIASGILSVGTASFSLAGSWWNYGGLFYATSGNNVSLTGTGTNFIRSAGNEFQDITLTGAGTWTLADDMEVARPKTLYVNAGTLDLSSRTFRGGNIDKGAGTLTKGTSTVVLDSDATRVLDPGAFYNLRTEVASETNLVGYWKLDQGEGPTAWAMITGPQRHGALTNGPFWIDSNLPPLIEFANQGALSFDGVDDYVDIAVPITATNAPFSACAWASMSSLGDHGQLVGIDGTNISGFFLKFDTTSGKFAMHMTGTDAIGGTSYRATGSTTVALNTWYHVCGTFDGTSERLYVNGGLEATVAVPLTWVAGNHTMIGSSKWSGARTDFFTGSIDDVRIYNVALTLAQVAALAAGRYAGTGTTVTYTLGANTTASNNFAVDSGTFATGAATGFTMGTTSTTAVAYVNTGTYTVGNAASTFAGGLTVRDAGTLNLATSGGAVKIGGSSTETLVMDGTLNASSTGATIQSSGTFYAFQVGSTAAATPTLNITGLAVKNTDTNGMYINAVVGASTTFTRFDNIAFSAGTGTRLLQIYSPQLYLVSNGCSFDGGIATGSTTSNAELRGNGNGSNSETRIMFGGATCATNKTPCESFDADNDSGADGVGDTTATNAAVIQWLHTAFSDTSGTIEGFPTAAFDWNMFTYYSTYVAFHDVDGTDADRIYVRDTNGNPKSATSYWDTPTGVDIIGTPRYDTLNAVPYTHYVYVATTNGKVYRLIDDTTAKTLTQDNSGSWAGAANPYSCGCVITTPLTVDDNNIYWGGTASGNKVWSLVKTTRTLVATSPFAVTAVISGAAPAVWISGHTYIFMGSSAHFFKSDINTQGLTTDNASPTGTVNGRLSVINNKVYGADNRGSLFVLDPTTFGTTLWSYHDDRATYGHNGCTSGGGCAVISSIYVDYLLNRAFYGDSDGHLYASYNSSGTTGAQATGFPYPPLTASTGEVYGAAPFYNAGVLVAGTTAGNLYVLDVNGGSGPVLKQTYKFGASTNISGIGYDRGSASYMVSTSNSGAKDGKIVYIDALTDPTPGSN